MRSYFYIAAVVVIVLPGLVSCNSADEMVVSSHLPDAITPSLGSTVEYNKLCMSVGREEPRGCRRALPVVVDAQRASVPISKLKAGSEGANPAP